MVHLRGAQRKSVALDPEKSPKTLTLKTKGSAVDVELDVVFEILVVDVS